MRLGKFFGWYCESPPLELIFNRGIIWDYLCSLSLKCKLVTYSNYQIPDGHLLQHLANWKLPLLCSLIAQFQAWTPPSHLVVRCYPAINSAKGLRTAGVWRQFNAWVILFLLTVPQLPLSCQPKPLGQFSLIGVGVCVCVWVSVGVSGCVSAPIWIWSLVKHIYNTTSL